MTAEQKRKDDLRIQREYLLRKFGKTIQATRYGRGHINSTWLIRKEKESDEIVVRFYPPFFKEKLATEVWVLRELNEYGVKVPRLLDVDIDGFSTPVLFMSKLSGTPLINRGKVLKVVATRELVGELRKLLDVVATIPTSVYGYLHDPVVASDIADYARKSSSRYLNTIKGAGLLPRKQIHILAELFELLQNRLASREVRLTYPDLSSGNILVSEDRFPASLIGSF
ncbi:MAG: hypothetical protein UW11_C0005G0021 [Parcubacteria group bacterium GW2011_GWA2_43_9b]|uniref:Aminoglycoside phosphotransferase domain-containing protein n=1 Tax=Candidatus Portnoybacteria bacterium RIFCSPLOWO2_02_FULL_39_11 TaxID=1802001 RepID=A0A1G2FSC1_9BACT|nr:MAG: hypothetical protein UW11_C0005G0021 [Parcubacteria group bacterium GW2011_GWA2_43_9b]OGZ40707.1 MAG: hypothetical protein A3B04_00835 [Candidatus Portnoybacteria bacterium RIFCSPLOWO2_02_FULL_39_11]